MVTFVLVLIPLIYTSTVFAAGLLTPNNRPDKPLDLKEHHVKVTVENGYVVTRVDQTFYNPYDSDLEALYKFPVPETASLAEFSMWIDGKKVSGEVVEKQKARQIYAEEKAAGRETGLTEKNERYSFEIRVFPVRANADAKMRLVYIQPVSVDTGMGRYVYPLESGGTDETQESFWTANEKVKEKFSFEFDLRSSVPVDGMRVPGFAQANISRISPREWNITINKSAAGPVQETISEEATGQQQGSPLETAGNESRAASEANNSSPAVFSLDKDILIYWRQAADVPARVDMVTYKPNAKGKGTFMITVTPGDELKKIKKGRDWVFVLDRSGSMAGKFETLLSGVERALGKMNDEDRFRIIMFEEQAEEITRGYTGATQANVKNMITTLSKEKPGGGTNLYAGLKMGLDAVDADRTTTMVLVTDGVANVGITKQKEFIKLLESRDIRLFTFMMGNSNNEFLLKHMAHASNGFAQAVSNSDDIIGLILSITGKVTHEALHGIRFEIDGVPVKNLVTNNTSSLYRGQQLIYFGHYTKPGPVTLTLTGKVSGEEKKYQTAFEFPDVSLDHPEIERLWAYAAIDEIKRAMVFEPNETESKEAIINLSCEYGIVTDYTSMLIVRDEIFKKHGINQTNKKRIKTEEQARNVRKAAPVTSRRVDTNKPMYTTRQATHRSSDGGGGGAVDGLFLLTLLPLAAFKLRRKKQ